MDDILTVPEVAIYLKADPAFVRELIRERRIPFVRLGPRKVIVPRRALDEWLRSESFSNLSDPDAPVLGLVAEK